MNIFLDFDGTLFDTTGDFKQDLFSVFDSSGISLEDVEETYKEIFTMRICGGVMYSPRQHLNILQQKSLLKDDKNDILKKLDSFMKRDFSRYVFPDVFSFLGSFEKEDLHILTFGENDFQREKVARSGIEKHVADIFVTQVEKHRTIDQICGKETEDVFFVDDSLSMVSEMNRSLSWVKTILLSRSERRKNDLNKKEFNFEAQSLEEVKRIIFNKEC